MNHPGRCEQEACLIKCRPPRRGIETGTIMNLRKACITLAALVLSGCASPPSQQPPAGDDFKPTVISVIEKDNLSAFCAGNRSLLGCAVQLRETNQCIVFVKSGLPDEALGCIVTHETKHCFDNVIEAAAARTRFPAGCGIGVASTVLVRTSE